VPTTPFEELPQDWQEEVTALRRQKDSFRKQFQEHKTKYEEAGELLGAANAKLEKFAELEDTVGKLTAQTSTKDLELAKVRATAAAGLDLSFADRLKGATEDEFKADAISLAEQFGKKAPPAFVDKSQGQGAGGAGNGKVEPLNSGNFAEDLAAALANMDDSDSGGSGA
jgi:hypothetical protein